MVNHEKRFGSLCKILLFMAVLASGSAAAATVVLEPIADTYVYSSQPTTNYGPDPVLSSGDVVSGNTVVRWITYLKFDLSAIPDGLSVTGATLNLYQVNGAGFLLSGTDAAYVADDSWAEGTATYNTRPTFGAVLGSTPDDQDHRGWSQWNLLATGEWDPGTDLADNLLSLAVKESGGSSTHNWCSRESDLMNCLAPGETGPVDELRRPYLEVTYVPLPAAAWFFAGALFSLVGLRSRQPS